MDNVILPMGTKVLKRDGSLEDFDAEKIHEVLFWATKDIKGVSVSDIAINAKLQIYNEIPTSDIHKLVISSAVDLISEETPNYQFVAANLLNFFLRKEVFGTSDNLPHLLDVIKRNIELGLYDPKFLEWYTEDEINEINKLIKHNRDYSFTYAGLQQMVDKYLVQDRTTKNVFETPQYAFMLISMSFNQGIEDSKKRLKAIKKSYNHYSNFNISNPTPILAGVRSPSRQYSSCVLADVGDDLDSIFATNHLIGTYTANRAGIGLNVGRIRSIGSKIRGGEVVHTGLVPYLKMFESTVRSCTQNGLRGGSCNIFFPFFNYEIKDLLVLKNNRGTDDNRVRKIDYTIQFNKLFYKRFLANEDITLFSTSDVPGLYEAFFESNEKFEELYTKYEKDPSIRKIVVSSSEIFGQYCKERFETGRIYSMNVDHANDHSPFIESVYMSNLCLTGDTELSVTVDGVPMDLSLEEVCDLHKAGKEVQVMSKDVETGSISYEKITAAALTNDDAELLEIEDSETGNKIQCTPDHKIYTKNRGYVEARNLEESDILDII